MVGRDDRARAAGDPHDPGGARRLEAEPLERARELLGDVAPPRPADEVAPPVGASLTERVAVRAVARERGGEQSGELEEVGARQPPAVDEPVLGRRPTGAGRRLLLALEDRRLLERGDVRSDRVDVDAGGLGELGQRPRAVAGEVAHDAQSHRIRDGVEHPHGGKGTRRAARIRQAHEASGATWRRGAAAPGARGTGRIAIPGRPRRAAHRLFRYWTRSDFWEADRPRWLQLL